MTKKHFNDSLTVTKMQTCSAISNEFMKDINIRKFRINEPSIVILHTFDSLKLQALIQTTSYQTKIKVHEKHLFS
jgi:hypothetical protein